MVRFALFPLLFALTLAGGSALGSERDHDRARAAMRAGEVLPLATVLQRVAPAHPGEVLEVELEREGGRWIYELKLLQRGGALIKLEVDARSGEVLKRQERR